MKCFVSSSIASSNLLKDAGYDDAELNDVGGPDVYVDGADELNTKFEAIKGGGGALTREKIIASASKKFIWCAASKLYFPMAVLLRSKRYAPQFKYFPISLANDRI